ncbi:ATP-binding protein [Pseudomonas sp. DTU_2021_1001937_2_SI_NGA_ILE_001]|uniref:ATP-binding protein n=1 Tax=Pseudomonas sp. DTU_2021_1001937_2_SI_NGA_ILE_001 TaxID=3077589 RepID=UPI0028FC238B|nr:ATP-binding protein [Pseudomonas sp. DTU_2021_1001937_2_SI_NGA_ILE_001]WNW10249.1 ATP-binding protein [Pseudomonas sp. DTU_2021_1001937_2_SI_NGA_ILE_001]
MQTPKQLSLRHWMWKALASSALIPLIAVELVLIGVYLFTNQSIRTAQIDYLHDTAVSDLVDSVGQNTQVVNGELVRLASEARLLAKLTEHVLQHDHSETEDLNLSEDGVRYDNGGPDRAASFYSSVTPLERQNLAKIGKLKTLDPLLKQLKNDNPLVASIYFNSWDSYNRIYPGFDVLQQYPHDLNIPEFNFYYLADAVHNPERRNRWTDVYLDPAGNGWMMSAIAPVYRGDFLEGVVGIDVTVGGILKQINELKVPWNGYLMLVAPDLTIMALPQAGEHDFHVTELTEHLYQQMVTSETLKPAMFNLRFNGAHDDLANAVETEPRGLLATQFAGRPHLVAWDTVADTGWHLLAVVEEAQITATTNSLASHYRRVGYLLIGGLAVFYAGFFLFTWARVTRLSQALSKPLAGVAHMMKQISDGQWRPEKPDTSIRELAGMAEQARTMGERLCQAEQSRSGAQQRLEVVMESSTEGLWEFHVQKRELRLRGSLCHRFDLPETLPDHQLFKERLDRADGEAVTRFIKELEQGRGAEGCELRLIDNRGKNVWLQCRGRVLERDEVTGEPRLLAGTCMDITALKHVETDLRHKTLEAEAASQAKSRFISSMTHELKTPLNAIHGFAQLLKYSDTSRSGAGPVEEILKASHHLCQLVNDLLSWSSLQAEKPVLNVSRIDMTELIGECVEMVRQEAKDAGLTLNVAEIRPGPGVVADSRRLRQVLLNLLSNAIKYNRPGGSVTLGCRHEQGRVRIYVEDTGMGIDSQARARLFEPFQRLGQEKTAIPGTGIGLALCKELAQAMNGSIGLVSTPGSGSLFWIELPCSATPDKPPAKVAGHASVLCLQRGDSEKKLIRETLAPLARVRLVEEERELLDEMARQRPKLLIIDLDSLGEALQPLLATLHELHQGPRPPLIVMSAQTMPAWLLSLDCQGLLRKPIDATELRELAAVFLSEDA